MKTLCTFLSLFLLFSSAAQVRSVITLSGKVTDAATGLPLAGASVYFADARIGTSTDTAGNYLLRHVPAGHHLLEVSFVGYNTIVEHMDLEGETVRHFALSPSVAENLGVTVTGVTSATSTRNAPIPVTIMRRSQLLQTPSTNLIDALSRQPGVAQVSTGPAISKPVIRGLGFNRVVVVNDGVRQEGQQWGEEHGIEIDESSVVRAEILKGPASIMYGSDALAGVVNFISHYPVADGEIEGNVITSYQTNNGQVNGHASLAGNQRGLNWNLYGSFKSAADYRNRYDGRVLNARFREGNWGGYVGLNKNWGYSHLLFSRFHQQLGMVEGERDEAGGAFLIYPDSPLERIASPAELKSRELTTPYQDVRHSRLALDNSIALGRSRLKVNLGFQNNLRREFGNPENLDETELAFDLNTLTYTAQLQLPEHRNWQTTVGLSGMWQGNRNKGEEAIIPDYRLFDAGGFLYIQKSLEKLTLSGGARFDSRSINSREMRAESDIKFPSFGRHFSNFSGTAGLSYRPKDYITLKANLARGFRSPTLSELASNGAHEGTNRYEYGRQGLRSERSLQMDAGLELDYAHITFSASTFYNRVQDFIFYRRLQSQAGGDSLITLDGEELEAFEYGQQDARLSGIELVADLHPHPLDWLHVENTLSFVRGRFDAELDGSQNLPMIPAPRWTSELRVSFPRAGSALRNLYASLELDRSFRQQHPFTGYNTETETPAYTLLHAGLGTDVGRKNRTLFSLHLSATNLTDQAYQQHLSRLKYAAVNEATGRRGVFNMGRNFSLKIHVPFTIK